MFGNLARVRLELETPDPDACTSLVVKFPAAEESNRGTAELLDLYDRELRFYAHARDNPVPTPRVLYQKMGEQNRFVLIMEELAHHEMADQVKGTTAEQTLMAIRTIAELHARYWGRVDDLDWLKDRSARDYVELIQAVYQMSVDKVFEVAEESFTPQMAELTRKLGDAIPVVMEHLGSQPRTISHGDLRADNLLFAKRPEDPPLTVVDWQLVAKSRGIYDIGYHMSQSVPTHVRRSIEARALREYHAILVEQGVSDYSFEDVWYDYRMAVLFCHVFPVIMPSRVDMSHERSRALAKAFLERSLAALEDVDAAGLLLRPDRSSDAAE